MGSCSSSCSRSKAFESTEATESESDCSTERNSLDSVTPDGKGPTRPGLPARKPSVRAIKKSPEASTPKQRHGHGDKNDENHEPRRIPNRRPSTMGVKRMPGVQNHRGNKKEKDQKLHQTPTRRASVMGTKRVPKQQKKNLHPAPQDQGDNHRSAAELLTFFQETARSEKALPNGVVGEDPAGNNHYNEGISCSAKSQWDNAAAAFLRAIELHPEYALAHFNLGLVYEHLHFHSKASSAYSRSIGLDPDHALSYYHLGITFEAVGKEKEAAAAYLKSIHLDPEQAEAHYKLGFLHNSMGRRGMAVDSFVRAIELNPEHASAHYNLGCLYQSLPGRRNEALKHVEEAARLNPFRHHYEEKADEIRAQFWG